VVALTAEMLFVFAVILAALALFATEPVPVDVTAIGVMVTLLLADPVTELLADAGLIAAPFALLSTAEGLSGFASSATITVFAMFILSDGVQRTGIVQVLGRKLATFTGDDETRQLGVTMGLVGPISGFINNTAAVAILLPMVTDLAHEGNTSPSKLLIPLSYASMFGGMLTLVGTSTNILANDVAGRVLNEYDPATYSTSPIGMFDFTLLGAVVMLVGFAYFFVAGRYLLPERIKPESDLTAEFEMAEYLTEVEVREDSPLVGRRVQAALVETEFDVDLLQLVRDGRTFLEPLGPKEIHAGDVFVVRTDRDTLVDLLDVEGLDLVPDVTVDEAELETAEESQNLVEVVVAPNSSLVGESLVSSAFRQRYDATVLALRRGESVVRKRLDDVRLRVGDTLLVQATAESIGRLDGNRDFIVAQTIDREDRRTDKVPIAVGIVLGVVGVAAFTPVPIVASALTGALGMVLTGCLEPGEIYDAVQWDVVVLLAGVIPLGIAMENSGGADLLAAGVVASADLVAASPIASVEGLTPAVIIGLLYLVTALLTNIISNNASVVLMIPVAIQAALELGADPLSYVFAVAFAASTAFMTPVGYQTNLFVYGPGGYRFTDYLTVGTPLQLVFTVVTTVGIVVLY